MKGIAFSRIGAVITIDRDDVDAPKGCIVEHDIQTEHEGNTVKGVDFGEPETHSERFGISIEFNTKKDRDDIARFIASGSFWATMGVIPKIITKL